MAHTQTVWSNDDHTDDEPTVRARMNVIETDLAALGAPTKAGTPTDADVPAGAVAVDGMIFVDTTASKIWTRIGGVWKGVAVA